MNIIETIKLFEKLITETENKYEIKIYKNFNGILSDLKNRELKEKQIQSIEKELDILKLKANPEKRKRYFKRKLTTFKVYLKKELSLISKGYYTAIGMSLGMCFGVALGSSVFGLSSGTSSGLAIGMLIGIVIGRKLDTKAEKEGRVLKIKIQ